MNVPQNVIAKDVPVREELEALVRHYHHVQNEHHRAAPQGSIRRRLEDKLLPLQERIDRVLEDWVPDDDLRAEWRAYLHHRAPEPAGPPAIRALVYRGRSEAGSIAEVRGEGDELEVWVDGTLTERVVAEKDFLPTRTPVHFRFDGKEFDEIFAVSPDAFRALASFHETGGSPPWEYAAELLGDGLINVHFDLTPRGRRALVLLV